MKILIDPIITTRPRRCATTIKMVRTIQYLQQNGYPDLYVYWTRPVGDPKLWDEEDEAWLKVELADMYDRIQFVAVNCTDDRYKGYTTLRRDLEYVYAFDGDCWDWDVCVTNRSALVPILRMISLKNGRNSMAWTRRIIVYEDMPMMSFKGYVATSHLDAWDAQTVLGYALADKVAVCAFWEKKHIMDAARKHLSPSNARRVDKNVIETTPARMAAPSFKSKEFVMSQHDHSKPFTISFSGRIVMGQRLDDIFEIMQKQWVFRGGAEDRIRCVMTTASKGLSGHTHKLLKQAPDLIEFEPADRDRFWDIVKNESCIGVYLSDEEEYSMSVMEPIQMGLPMVLLRAEWSIASVGPDYPFFVRNTTEAYGVIRAFYEDYAAQYSRFVEWARTSLAPLLQERNSVWNPIAVREQIDQYREEFENRREKQAEAARRNEVLTLIGEETNPGDVIDLKEMVRDLDKRGKLDAFARKTCSEQRDAFRLPYSTDWNSYRMGLKWGFDFEDAGKQPGLLRRK